VRSRRYPQWCVYLAGFGAFVFLTSLLGLMLAPASDPPSMLERGLWAALLFAFLALLPLFFLRLRYMVTRIVEGPERESGDSRRQQPGAPSERTGRDRDDDT